MTKFLNDNALWLLAILFAFLLGMAWANHEVALDIWRYMQGIPDPSFGFITT